MTEANKNIDGFFDIFKEKLNNFLPEVPENEIIQSWEQVSRNIPVHQPLSPHPANKWINLKNLLITGAGLTTAIIATVLISRVLFSDKTDIKPETPVVTENNIIADSNLGISALQEKKNDNYPTDDYPINEMAISKSNTSDPFRNSEKPSIVYQPSITDFKPDKTIVNSFVYFSDTIICEGGQIQVYSTSEPRDETRNITLILPDQQINNFKGNKNIKFDKAGTYIIYVIIASKDQAYKSIQKIYVLSRPQASFGYDNTQAPEIKFINLSSNADHFYWDFGDGSTSNLTHPSHIFTKNNTFKVKLTAENKYGCKEESIKEITINIYQTSSEPYIPNYFSPNGDGKDDYYYISINDEIFFDLTITDRYGNPVFSAKNKEKKWDGVNETSGNPCPEGQYFYFFQYQTKNMTTIEKKSGTIYLKRLK